MTMYSFGQLAAWGAKALSRADGVFKESAQEVFSLAQKPVAQGGNMPVDTGYLRNNSAMSTVNDQVVARGTGDAYQAAILGAALGDTIGFYWGAEYARAVEYGANGRPGRAFMRSAAAEWPNIVDKHAKRAASLP